MPPPGSVIMIVEDDPPIRELMQCLLQDEGYSVVSAPNGREAVDCALQCQPALVVLDLGLPLRDGVQVANILRQLQGPETELIVVSADLEAPQKAAEVGASVLIEKPFDLDDLLDAVSRVMKRHASVGVMQPSDRDSYASREVAAV